MNFKFYRGETFSKYITIQGWKETIDEIYFTIKKDKENKNYELQKTLGNGILIAESNEDSFTINLTIDADDTDLMKCMNYYYDLKIVSGKLKKEILVGKVTLENNITFKCNEVS